MSKVDKKRHAELSERVDDLTIKLEEEGDSCCHRYGASGLGKAAAYARPGVVAVKQRPTSAIYHLNSRHRHPLIVYIDNGAGGVWKLRRYQAFQIELTYIEEGTYVTACCTASNPRENAGQQVVQFVAGEGGTVPPGRDYVRTILNYCKEYLEWDW